MFLTFYALFEFMHISFSKLLSSDVVDNTCSKLIKNNYEIGDLALIPKKLDKFNEKLKNKMQIIEEINSNSFQKILKKNVAVQTNRLYSEILYSNAIIDVNKNLKNIFHKNK